MTRKVEGNNVLLTGKDLREYIKIRFPNTCLRCLGRPSKKENCKACDGTGIKHFDQANNEIV